MSGLLTVLSPLASAPDADADALADALRRLSDAHRRRAFVRTAHAVIDWRGQTVSADRQLGLLRDVPVLVAWGAKDTTIPPHHHQTFAGRVPHAVMTEIPGAGHFPDETSPEQLLAAIPLFLFSTRPFEYAESTWTDLLVARGPGPDGVTASVEPKSSGEAWGQRRTLDMGIGALMELRNCSARSAIRELTLASHESGLSTHAMGTALVDLVGGDRSAQGAHSVERGEAHRRWAHLINVRTQLDGATQETSPSMAGDLTIRYGGVDDYTRC